MGYAEGLDGRGELVQTFTYDDLWQPATDGGGHSLHIIDSAGPKESWDQAPSWRASEEVDGSPGFADGSVVPSTGWQLPGDSNGDGLLDISDPVRILRRLFLGKPEAPCDGDSFETGGNRVVADVNGDDAVDVSDVLYLLSAWGTDDPNADFDDNGVVNVDDILILLSQFGEACP